MPSKHFQPPVNNKRSMSNDDWAGWYQITILDSGKLSVRCVWWDGRKWNHGPNTRGGLDTSELGDVRAIVHLVEA
jgi:hypothetical protein